MKTPVAFFIFNRPDTTERVFEAIRRAKPPMLLIVADGARKNRPGEREMCAAARSAAEKVDWPCTVLKNYSEANLGCGKRVSSGLDWVFSEVEEAIILEDDCLPHDSFFPFCDAMLERYRNDDRVMMIGGTNYLLDRYPGNDSYFFSRYFAIWGWASWRRAWNVCDPSMADWPRLKAEGRLASFYRQKYMQRHLTTAFDAAHAGRIDTWDTQWFYSCLFNNGLSVVPRVNLISNIGTIGAHSSGFSANIFFPVFDLGTENMRHPQKVLPDGAYDDPFFKEQFKPTIGKLLRKIQVFLRKRLSRWYPR